MPAVYVILPVYNAEKTVLRAVTSLLRQTWSDLEVIAVDDGSTDGTADVLDTISDRRFTFLRAPHRGVVEASNLALEQAQADVIARMDADDWSHPARLERQVALLENEQLDAVGCQVRIIDQQGRPVESLQRYQRWINEETLSPTQISALRFVELPLVNPTILARREYFGSGYRDTDLPEDFDLFLTAAARGLRFGKVAAPLFDWMDGPQRLTRNDPRYSDEAFDVCRRRHLLAGPLAARPQIDLWGAGQTGKRWLRWLQSEGIPVRQLLEVSPRKIGQTIHGVPVVDYRDLPTAEGTLLLAAVGADGARTMIWHELKERGYTMGEDVLFVA